MALAHVMRERVMSTNFIFTGTAPTLTEMWTTHRKELEVAIHKEKGKDHADPAPDLLPQEDRLRRRLSKLNMDMNVCRGDGNCLVSPGHTPSLCDLMTPLFYDWAVSMAAAQVKLLPLCLNSSEQCPWSYGVQRTSMKVSGGEVLGT